VRRAASESSGDTARPTRHAAEEAVDAAAVSDDDEAASQSMEIDTKLFKGKIGKFPMIEPSLIDH
jgi:hypothetical protein